MVELVFAIVVIGLVLMAAPNLIGAAAKTTTVALQQEGINEAASRINMILTYPWDQNDTNDSCIPPVLRVESGDSELDESSAARRIGVPLQSSSHTFLCDGQEYNASAIGKEGSEYDDLDDFNETSSMELIHTGSGGTDYIEKDTVQITTLITYIGDSASYGSKSFAYAPGSPSTTGTTNIKEINVTLTSSSTSEELNKNITLRAFSCNLGGIEYAHREMP